MHLPLQQSSSKAFHTCQSADHVVSSGPDVRCEACKSVQMNHCQLLSCPVPNHFVVARPPFHPRSYRLLLDVDTHVECVFALDSPYARPGSRRSLITSFTSSLQRLLRDANRRSVFERSPQYCSLPGHPCSFAHVSTSVCPLRWALRSVLASHGHCCSRSHINMSRSPPPATSPHISSVAHRFLHTYVHRQPGAYTRPLLSST
jgi:hypothetical protein